MDLQFRFFACRSAISAPFSFSKRRGTISGDYERLKVGGAGRNRTDA